MNPKYWCKNLWWTLEQPQGLCLYRATTEQDHLWTRLCISSWIAGLINVRGWISLWITNLRMDEDDEGVKPLSFLPLRKLGNWSAGQSMVHLSLTCDIHTASPRSASSRPSKAHDTLAVVVCRSPCVRLVDESTPIWSWIALIAAEWKMSWCYFKLLHCLCKLSYRRHMPRRRIAPNELFLSNRHRHSEHYFQFVCSQGTSEEFHLQSDRGVLEGRDDNEPRAHVWADAHICLRREC